MDFYNYILKHFSNFPFNAVIGTGHPTSFFSTLDGVNCMRENYVYGTNASCTKEYISEIGTINLRDYSYYIKDNDLYEKSIYTMSKVNSTNIFKIYLDIDGYFTFIDDKFFYSNSIKKAYHIPSTLEEWFNLNMLTENILTLEEFEIVNQIRKVIPSNINVEIYHDAWDEHKKSLTNDIKSIK